MNYVTKLDSSELKSIIKYSYDNLDSHSLETLSKRLDNIFT